MRSLSSYGLAGALCAATILTAPAAWAAPNGDWNGSNPGVFRRDSASAIGRSRHHYDRAMYNSYRGNPGAQFELRQKRQNLCRNVPEMC